QRVDPELVPGQGSFLGDRGGLQRQGETHDEKSVRLPHLPSDRSRAVSHTWRSSATKHNPQILLSNQKMEMFLIVGHMRPIEAPPVFAAELNYFAFLQLGSTPCGMCT